VLIRGMKLLIIRGKERIWAVDKAGEGAEGKKETGAEKDSKAGRNPEGDGQSAPSGDFFCHLRTIAPESEGATAEVRGRDKIGDTAASAWLKRRARPRAGDTARNSADALKRH